VDVIERLLWLCSHLSVTGDEAGLTDALEEHHKNEVVQRVGDSLVIGEPDERPTVALVGHLDVVPPTDEDRDPRVAEREDGPVVVGRGASDMKSGVAVGEVLFADRELRRRSPYCLVQVLYAREEGPAEENELADVLAEVTWLADVEFAIVTEPTDLEIQLGCLGGLHAALGFVGRQAHSARPWLGENALTKAGTLLTELHGRPPAEVEVDGIAYRDVLTATQAWTDNPRNVTPGRFMVNVNLRFAPSRDLVAAERELREWVGDRAEVEIVDRAPPAPPFRRAELVERFIETSGAPVTGKQAWTDVARFAEIGVPALNYGPGLTGQAHQAGEYVPVANLDLALGKLRRFLGG
jgi:succinyl-diaminopimelate desuccinylase